MDFLKLAGSDLGEVYVGHEEVHPEAGGPSRGIAVSSQQRSNGRDIFCRFKTVEIIGTLTEIDSQFLNFFPSLTVSQADPSPVVTLQKDKRTTKAKALGRQRRSATLQHSAHHV